MTDYKAAYEQWYSTRRASFPREAEQTSHYWACSELLRAYYRPRVNPDPTCLAFCEALARRQIGLSPFMAQRWLREFGPPLPANRGYQTMCSLLEHRDRLGDAISVAQAALAAGWGGTWEKTIARLTKRMQKKL